MLLSEVTRLFMATYSTKTRGGYLRFKAQYLRRLRIPEWRDVPEPLRAELIEAATRHDIAACNRAAFRLYGLTQEEQSALGGSGELAEGKRGVRRCPPRRADTEAMMYRRYVLENIRRGRQNAAEGKADSAEEVLTEIQSW